MHDLAESIRNALKQVKDALATKPDWRSAEIRALSNVEIKLEEAQLWEMRHGELANAPQQEGVVS